MKQSTIKKVLARAAEICAESGTRMTEKRQNILLLLLNSDTPLSAYEVVDSFGQSHKTSIPAMSVYRMLDFLASENLVHKLSSTNKYVACSHIACDHSHEVPQFLICGQCNKVKEVGIKKSLVEDLKTSVSGAGFRLMDTQLELDCLCDQCLQSKN